MQHPNVICSQLFAATRKHYFDPITIQANGVGLPDDDTLLSMMLAQMDLRFRVIGLVNFTGSAQAHKE
jgi:hypothetical protein